MVQFIHRFTCLMSITISLFTLLSAGSPRSPSTMNGNEEAVIRPLRFIHITKTGGTTVEEVALKYNVHWGTNDVELKDYVPKYIGAFWHYPFAFFPKRFNKHEHDWFLIHRDPYDRVISEFHCKWGGVGKDVHKYNQTTFNTYIQNKLHLLSTCIDIRHTKLKFACPHFLPQHYYVDHNVTIAMLPFAELETAFDDLMRKYHLPMRLNITHLHTNSQTHVFTKKDLSLDTIKMIRQTYKKDFEYFNYTMELH